MKKKMIAVVLVLALILTGVSVKPLTATYAKAKSLALNKKKIVMTVGQTQKIKLKNAGEKVKWIVAKKKVVKIVKKTGKYRNVIVIKGLKAGNTKITAKCGKKKYTIKVKVEKAKQQDSVPGTIPATTANKAVEMTVKVVETTTEKAVQEQTTKEQTTTAEETTLEQIPEVPTTSGETTVEPTSEEEPETEETTTEMPTLEAVTTKEETTTAPETTTRETKLVAEVLNDGLTTDDELQIKYYFDGPTEVVISTDENPHILEIYEDGKWIELEDRKESENFDGMPIISQERSYILKLPLSQIYEGVRPGHYRYTQPLYGSHLYEGENPYGESISVEFDVTYPEFYITGEVKNNQIKSTDNLEITYTIITESEAKYTYSTQPYYLYFRSEDILAPSVWSSPKIVSVSEREYQTMAGGGTIDITIPLEEYFGTLLPGKYKYVHEVNGKYAGVNFEIVEEEETN